MADLTTITAASFLDNQAQFCYWCNVKWKIEMRYGLELSQVSFIYYYFFCIWSYYHFCGMSCRIHSIQLFEKYQ